MVYIIWPSFTLGDRECYWVWQNELNVQYNFVYVYEVAFLATYSVSMDLPVVQYSSGNKWENSGARER